jgi:FolB domain-containing protein
MKDRIEIKNLKFEAVIGVHDWERESPQPLETDITLYTDLSRPCGSDNLDDTLDYGTVSRKILEKAASSSFFLLERLAREFADICLAYEGVDSVTIALRKPKAVAEAESAGVIIHREAR